MIYIVTATRMHFQHLCEERGVPTRTRSPEAIWVGPGTALNALRGRQFDQGDRVIVEDYDFPEKSDCLTHLSALEAVALFPPTWEWLHRYDTPPALDPESIERWLRA